jgi:hypothetical protein
VHVDTASCPDLISLEPETGPSTNTLCGLDEASVSIEYGVLSFR